MQTKHVKENETENAIARGNEIARENAIEREIERSNELERKIEIPRDIKNKDIIITSRGRNS
jgi:hypothetical protein